MDPESAIKYYYYYYYVNSSDRTNTSIHAWVISENVQLMENILRIRVYIMVLKRMKTATMFFLKKPSLVVFMLPIPYTEPEDCGIIYVKQNIT